MAFLSSLLSIASWLLGLFRASPDRALGRAEEVNRQQAEILKQVSMSNEIKTSVGALHDGDAAKLLHSKYRRE